MNKWIDLTEDLTKEGQDKIEVGQVLMFKDGETENNLKITCKKDGKVWAKHIVMYHPDQVLVENKPKKRKK